MQHAVSKQARQKFSEKHPVSVDDEKAIYFYKDIVRKFEFKTARSQRPVAFIVVAHMVHTLSPFLEALTQLGLVVAIIPKGSQCVPAVMSSLRDVYQSVIQNNVDKKMLREDAVSTEKFLRSVFFDNPDLLGHQLIVIDHGGYFRWAGEILGHLASITNRRVLGLVEHTENGRIRWAEYLKLGKRLPFEICTVAGTKLKAEEDSTIGRSIVDALTVKVFGGEGLNQDLARIGCIGVIGYGHVGEQVARAFRARFHYEVRILICDISEACCTRAREESFEVVSREFLLRTAKLVVTATSAVAIKREDIALMPSGACIACATSSDDQIDAHALEGYRKQDLPLGNTVASYVHEADAHRKIHFAANGGAANFLIGSTAHPILHGVLAAVAVLALRLLNRGVPFISDSIGSLGPEDERKVRDIWGSFFETASLANPSTLVTRSITAVASSAAVYASVAAQVGMFPLREYPYPSPPPVKNFQERRCKVLEDSSVNFCADLTVLLQRKKRVVLVGIPGAGKSQLASFYGQERKKNYYLVQWLDAETPELLEASYKRFCKNLEVGSQEMSLEALRVCLEERLRESPRCLIIYDNARVDILTRYGLSVTDAHDVLLTSTEHIWASYSVVPVGLFNEEEAVIFILRALKEYDIDETEMAAKALAILLGYLPLAISQAVYTISSYGMSITEYIDAYHNNYELKKKFLDGDEFAQDPHKVTTYMTWLLLRDRVKGKNSRAADILSMSAYLAADSIPKRFFAPPFDEVWRVLVGQSAIQILGSTSMRGGFSIHRLLQTVIQIEAKEVHRESNIVSAVIARANEQFAYDRDSQEKISYCRELYPHMRSLLAHMTSIGLSDIDLVLKVCEYILSERADGQLVVAYLTPYLVEVKKLTDLQRVSLYAQLAHAYFLYGQQIQSFEFIRLVLEGDFLPKVSDVEISAKIASVLITLGHFLEVEDRFDLVLQVCEKAELLFAQSLPDNALARIVIRVTMAKMRYQQYLGSGDESALRVASEIFSSAYQLLYGKYGEEHPEVLAVQCRLAEIAFSNKDTEEGCRLYRLIIRLKTKLCGTELHSEVASICRQYASNLQKIGDLELAFEYYAKAFDIRRRVYGNETHPHFFLTLKGWRDVCIALNRRDEAAQCEARLLAIQQKKHESHTPQREVLERLAEAACVKFDSIVSQRCVR